MEGKISSQSSFRAGLPIVATSFVNKTGSIGLSLLPMILVERNLSVSDSSLVMGIVKTTILAGTFLGGVISDKLGVRTVFLASFFLQGLGLAFLPVFSHIFLLIFAASCAQLGNSFFQATSRLLIKETVPFNQHQESIAWLRTGNNLGQVVSYSLGAVLASLGASILIIFDSFTSFLAFVVGLKWVPKKIVNNHPSNIGSELTNSYKTWKVFILFSLYLSGFTFFYEMFMVASAAQFKQLFGTEGLKIFSISMVINTVLCTLLSVPASKFFKNPAKSLPTGMFLLTIGSLLALNKSATMPLIYLGILIFTFGEIIFASLSQYVLLTIVPNSKSSGTIYSASTMMQAVARILSASLAFPLVIHGDYLNIIYIAGTIPFMFLFLLIKNDIKVNK